MTRERGTVKWFDETKRYGFVTADGSSTDLFVHASHIDALGQTLEKGDRVEFEIEQGQKGPEARKVVVIDPEV